eukprot:TRINITY_DN13560_c0_g1_i2.p1 TRINITY_DN13560_c0_g1~~TRINITY_DN13560_c0_g1_i2.p1  ORF type:complete len:406 (+),score=117.17 TRINITY_DN13560_c0_g1_i2:195-1412(+)
MAPILPKLHASSSAPSIVSALTSWGQGQLSGTPQRASSESDLDGKIRNLLQRFPKRSERSVREVLEHCDGHAGIAAQKLRAEPFSPAQTQQDWHDWSAKEAPQQRFEEDSWQQEAATAAEVERQRFEAERHRKEKEEATRAAEVELQRREAERQRKEAEDAALAAGHDRGAVLRVVASNGKALAYASDALRADREIVLSAVRSSGSALQFAAEELRGDKEIVSAAVRKNGKALQFASEDLQADRDVVLLAVNRSGKALQFAAGHLRADKHLVLVAVKESPGALQYASEVLRANKKDWQALETLQQFPKHHWHNRDTVMKFVQADGMALWFAADELKADKALVLAAIKKDAFALQYASPELRADKEVVHAAVKKDPKALKYASQALIHQCALEQLMSTTQRVSFWD